MEEFAIKLIEEKNNDEDGDFSNWEIFLKRNRWVLTFFLMGILFLGIGFLGWRIFDFEQSEKVEIIESDIDEKQGEIVVEIAGEVQKPGVYSLKMGSRVNDLLLAAGGFSANADREWVAKNLNLAQKLSDGIKIYIPKYSSGEKRETVGLVSGVSGGLINVNNASKRELEELWGVGPATAEKIIAGRPYQRIEELIEKKIIKSNIWEKIKDKITVY